MKILIVSQYFWPENFRINALAEELYKRGNEVKVLTGFPNYPEGQIYKDFKENTKFYNKYRNISITRVPIISRGQNKYCLIINYLSFLLSGCIIGSWKLRNEKFDLIFTFQTSPVFVGLVSAFISKVKKIPHAIWVLDLWPETLEAIGVLKSKFKLELVRKLVLFIYKRCDIIFVQSKGFLENISNYQIKNKKIIYFPNWADSEFFTKESLPAKEIKINKNVFTIIFAGNIGLAQDFNSIIKATKILKFKKIKFRLIIIGEGSMKSWVKNEIGKNKLEDCVMLYKKYELKRMPSFFMHANALLVSLSDEKLFEMTIPGKIQSYLAAGIPIIGMINGEGAQVIKDAKAGFTCNSGDYKKLAQIIIQMTKLKNLNEYGNNGKNFANLHFNKSKLIDNLDNELINLKELYLKK